MPHNYKVISLKIKKFRNFILRRSAIYLKQDLSTSYFFPILSRLETGRIKKLCTSIIHANFRTRSTGLEKRRAMSKKHNLINKSREWKINITSSVLVFHHSLSMLVITLSSLNVLCCYKLRQSCGKGVNESRSWICTVLGYAIFANKIAVCLQQLPNCSKAFN